jgi:hypothetical protein
MKRYFAIIALHASISGGCGGLPSVKWQARKGYGMPSFLKIHKKVPAFFRYRPEPLLKTVYRKAATIPDRSFFNGKDLSLETPVKADLVMPFADFGMYAAIG